MISIKIAAIQRYLLYLYVFLIPAGKLVSIGLGSAGGNTVGLLLGVLSVLLFVIYVCFRDWFPIPGAPFYFMFLLLAIYSGAAFTWYDNEHFPRQVITLANLIVFTFIMTQFITRERHLHNIIDAFIIGVFFMSLSFILSDVTGFGSRAIQTIDETGWTRFNNHVGGPNSIAYMVSIGAGLSLFRAFDATTQNPIRFYIFYVTALLAVIKTISITGFVTFGLISVGIFIFSPQFKRFTLAFKVLLACVFFVVMLIILLSSENLTNRIGIKWQQIFEWANFYGDYYYYYWASQRVGLGISAVQIGLEYPFGVGPIVAMEMIGEKVLEHIPYDHGEVDAHNSYLHFMAETGIVGFILLIIGTYLFVRRHQNILKVLWSSSNLFLGQALYVLLIVVIFANGLNTFYRYKETWLIILLIIAFQNIQFLGPSNNSKNPQKLFNGVVRTGVSKGG